MNFFLSEAHLAELLAACKLLIHSGLVASDKPPNGRRAFTPAVKRLWGRPPALHGVTFPLSPHHIQKPSGRLALTFCF